MAPTELFAGGVKILAGRADLESEGILRKGDEALFGVCLDVHGHQQVWYVHLRVLSVKVHHGLMWWSTQPWERRLLREPVASEAATPRVTSIVREQGVACAVENRDRFGCHEVPVLLAVERLEVGSASVLEQPRPDDLDAFELRFRYLYDTMESALQRPRLDQELPTHAVCVGQLWTLLCVICPPLPVEPRSGR